MNCLTHLNSFKRKYLGADICEWPRCIIAMKKCMFSRNVLSHLVEFLLTQFPYYLVSFILSLFDTNVLKWSDFKYIFAIKNVKFICQKHTLIRKKNLVSRCLLVKYVKICWFTSIFWATWDEFKNVTKWHKRYLSVC